jgi:hypothetical protein
MDTVYTLQISPYFTSSCVEAMTPSVVVFEGGDLCS